MLEAQIRTLHDCLGTNITVRIRIFENMTCGGERPGAYIYVYIGPKAQIEDVK